MTGTRRFPTRRVRLFLLGYGLLWAVALPLVLAYLWWRGRRDRLYAQHPGERFGVYARPPLPGAVWVHAVSLGELRSAAPLIRALLDRGDRVVTTHFTPAGRREAMAVFAGDIAVGRLCPVWVPLEYDWVYRRFFRAFRPVCGLVMEIEIWPRMIASAHRRGVPLFMCNAQYPLKSLERDRARAPVRAALMTGFAGAFVKSDLQAARFAGVGVPAIEVTGELRFDQPIPEAQLLAGRRARAWLGAAARPVVALASVVEGEDALFIAAIGAARAAHAAAGQEPPLFVYIPRAPERFGDVARLLAQAGLATLRRSDGFDAGFAPVGMPPRPLDVLLGDSLGEMYAYLALSDRVVVGGGFTPKGSHNISEALSLGKAVMTGPDIHTIEYPAMEALAAGVLTRLKDEAALRAALAPDHPPDPPADRIATFFALHCGAVAKTLAALDRRLTSR
ncbi:MAG: 3-deoxy-D-manno-octulosonic acid transferase [Rhodobacter sp.]|nr:3-deoxy-D-manno-octulosonic acid transferase [Rhodobacter sp.]